MIDGTYASDLGMRVAQGAGLVLPREPELHWLS